MTANGTIWQALAAAAGTPRGIRVLEYDGRSSVLSYASLAREALLVGGTLVARGLRPGDRVALVIPEIGDFIRAFFGISAAGLVPVPLVPPAQAGDVRTFTRQTRQLVTAGRVAAVVTSPDLAPLFDLAEIENRPSILNADRLRGGPSLVDAAPSSATDAALVQFTSGSTAAPKGVVLSHANVHANVLAIAAGLDVTPSDVGVGWLPLYHDMGLIGMLLAATYATVDVVIMSPMLFLKRPTVWLEAISTYRGTISFAPSFAYDLCLRRVKPSQMHQIDLSSWRVSGCGAEPIHALTLQTFADRFACAGFNPTSFVPSYGLAEHSLAVTFSRGGLKVDSVDPARLGRDSRAVPTINGSPAVQIVSCGRPSPRHEVAVVDEHGAPLPERHVGRIVARGPSVMVGYFDDPAATAEALAGGWLHTGDVGYLADGELYVCGRLKDVIIRQGRKYHPPDLEASIADVQGVRPSGVVVFGVNRPAEADEVVVVLEARGATASDAIAEVVRRRVRETAGLEIDRIVLAPPGTIPRTTSGKIRQIGRASCRERV